ncbi:DUF4397 domain-containing protein [Algoriphagus confluentis]|uniref:DUF4397 domain-containing protein n=1 Tax=Algoriphagus confluentis TaxID=1697556 RepID=A0ABQ6PIZ7_9BACT|nr:hypothetical protein Aconfl_04930 [Algoriphagus confluentis]
MRVAKSILSALALGGTLLMSSCFDNLENTPLPPTAYVSIYQGSPDAPAMDIFANSNRVNRDPMEFTQVLGYSPFFPGVRDFRFAAVNSASSLLEKEVDLKADSVYSLFIINETVNLDAFLVKDIWEEPSASQAQLRLVHLSPDTESVDLLANEASTPLLEEASYKEVSDYLELSPGNTVLKIRSSQTGETLLTSGTLDLKGNRVYTLVIRGLSSEASGPKKLDIQLITNYIAY